MKDRLQSVITSDQCDLISSLKPQIRETFLSVLKSSRNELGKLVC